MALAGLGGCARTAEERQLDMLREDIASVQADRDRQDAREALSREERELTAKTDDPSKPLDTRFVASKPVKINPDGSEQAQNAGSEAAASQTTSDDPEDGSPRPVIRVSGGARGKAPPLIEETLPDEDAKPPAAGGAGPRITENAPRPSALDPEAKRSYDAALALVNGKQYGPALEAFAAFLVRWPDHPYADNATYWRGECYFAQGEYARAVEQFEGVITRFPMGNKVPDAWLKLGIAYGKLGNPQKSKNAFSTLSQNYPKSDAARRIPRTENP